MTEQPTPEAAPAPPADDPVTARAADAIRAAWPEALEEVVLEGRHPFLVVKPAWLRPCCALLRDDERLRFDCCHLVSGVDRPEAGQIEVVYHLVSYARKEPAGYASRPQKNDGWVALKVRVPRDDPRVPTVCDIWTGADWHERETYDLMGVVFTGRTDLRRILLPEDWPGHPLRKDWTWPVSYHGLPIVPPEAQ